MDKKELTEKVEEFSSRKVYLTSKKYYHIVKELPLLSRRLSKGRISKKKFDLIIYEIEKAEIKFDNWEDFRIFTNIIVENDMFRDVNESRVNIILRRGIERSKPYKEAGINSYFGWRKFIRPPSVWPFHQPFGEKFNSLQTFEQDNLKYKSLNAVSEKRECELDAIKDLEKEYGDKIKE